MFPLRGGGWQITQFELVCHYSRSLSALSICSVIYVLGFSSFWGWGSTSVSRLAKCQVSGLGFIVGHFITREEIQLSSCLLLFWPLFLWPEQAANEIKVNKQELPSSAAGYCLCHSVWPTAVSGLWSGSPVSGLWSLASGLWPIGSGHSCCGRESFLPMGSPFLSFPLCTRFGANKPQKPVIVLTQSDNGPHKVEDMAQGSLSMSQHLKCECGANSRTRTEHNFQWKIGAICCAQKRALLC